MRHSLLDPSIGEARRGSFSLRSQQPDFDCLDAMTDYDQRGAEARWLLNWSPDLDAYPASRLEIDRLATSWRVRFRDARDRKWRTVHVPLRGTPPPPGWKEGK